MPLLLQNGDYLLLQNGDRLLLQDETAGGSGQTINLGQATEAETCNSLTVANPRTYALGLTTETETCNFLYSSKSENLFHLCYSRNRDSQFPNCIESTIIYSLCCN
jgi:hypothetical protein